MLPHTRKSSMSVSQPSAWLNVSRIVLWNTSWAKTTPNRTTRNRNLPKGILNVHVRYELSVSSSICQNPNLASRLLKYLAPASLLMISCWLGGKYCSRKITLLRLLQVETDSRITISFFIYDHTVHLLRWFLHFCYHSLLLHFHQFGAYSLQELLEAFLEG